MYCEKMNGERQRRSHAGTVVPECFKDDNASQWKSGKFDPRSLKNPPNRSSPKCAWVTTSWTPTPMQNFIKIRLPPFAPPQIRENSRRVTRLVFLGFFCQPTAKTPAPIGVWAITKIIFHYIGSPREKISQKSFFCVCGGLLFTHTVEHSVHAGV